ncbi:hypothetical protein M404DRAFT_1005279, partial [Pisolithus tinctorius Marx 270]
MYEMTLATSYNESSPVAWKHKLYARICADGRKWGQRNERYCRPDPGPFGNLAGLLFPYDVSS